MIEGIVKEWRGITIQLRERGQALYFPYDGNGFGKAFFDEKFTENGRVMVRPGSFYFKFMGVDKKLEEELKRLVSSVTYTGIFSRDKELLKKAIIEHFGW